MTNRYIVNPFRFGPSRTDVPTAFRNGIAVTDDADQHLRDKILAVLFTSPGERVNQPRFGVGLDRTVFDAMNDLTISALEFRLTEGLRTDLGDEVTITNLDIQTDQPAGRLTISIDYYRRADRQPRNLEVQI